MEITLSPSSEYESFGHSLPRNVGSSFASENFQSFRQTKTSSLSSFHHGNRRTMHHQYSDKEILGGSWQHLVEDLPEAKRFQLSSSWDQLNTFRHNEPEESVEHLNFYNETHSPSSYSANFSSSFDYPPDPFESSEMPPSTDPIAHQDIHSQEHSPEQLITHTLARPGRFKNFKPHNIFHSHRDSIITTKGLLNAPGQNNCFLNSAVQVS